MLNKAICRKCINAAYQANNYQWGWDDNDEFIWDDEQTVACPKFKKYHQQYTNQPPHEDCPYILEHLMKANQDAQ